MTASHSRRLRSSRSRAARADLGLLLLRHGYAAIGIDRRARGGSATYESRLLGRRALVLGDASGARVFYDEDLARRARALPAAPADLLFGRGAVHTLDGDEHRARKDLFLGLLGPDQVAPCADLVEQHLTRRVEGWGPTRTVSMHGELVEVYGAAVLAWAGVDLRADRSRSLARGHARVVEGFGFSFPAFPRAWAARRRTDSWARSLVRDVRSGRTVAREGSVLSRLASSALSDRTAGVELGNVVRPTIAVSWPATFAVAAMAGLQPGVRHRLAWDATLRRSFIEEVRRATPFTPALVARAVTDFSHAGRRVSAGQRLVLDVRGINEDPHVFEAPEVFRADRFVDFHPDPYQLVPQGGGDSSGHRCPGEAMTVQLLERTVEVLAGTGLVLVSAPHAPLTRMPTLPDAGLEVRVTRDQPDRPERDGPTDYSFHSDHSAQRSLRA